MSDNQETPNEPTASGSGGDAITSGSHPIGDQPHVVIKPPVLFAGAALFGLVFSTFLPDFPFSALSAPIRLAAGVIVIAIGGGVVTWCFLTFQQHGTNVQIADGGTKTLVTDGPYRFSRNPIYLGLAIGHLGLAVLAGSLWTALFLAPIIAVLQWGVIQREEAFLEHKFGEDYRNYMARTRRWI